MSVICCRDDGIQMSFLVGGKRKHLAPGQIEPDVVRLSGIRRQGRGSSTKRLTFTTMLFEKDYHGRGRDTRYCFTQEEIQGKKMCLHVECQI